MSGFIYKSKLVRRIEKMNIITMDTIDFQGHPIHDINRAPHLKLAVEYLIKKANEIIDKDNNYNVKLVTCKIEEALPIKLKIWVHNIKDRALFYNPDIEGQNHVHRIYFNTPYTPSIEHLIDVEEF